MKDRINTLKKNKLVIGLLATLLLAIAGSVMLGGRGPRGAATSIEDQHDQATAAVSDSGSSGRSGLAAYDKNGDGIVYQAGMHPHIVQDEPGQCPICGMDLMPVRVDGMEAGTVKIDPVTLQNIGVRTAPVTVEALGREVRTTGRFEANERALAAVSPKIGGWVERLYVDYEGARVRKGQPLLEIYSPDLVSTQEEYLLALRNAERLAATASAPDARRLVEAARRRLAYWDISEAQIRELEKTGEPRKTLTLYAPASGTVTMKNVVEGQQIMPGQTLMQLANLSRLWLMIDVYEQDLSWIEIGTTASIVLPYDPGRKLVGKVDYLYDELDPEARTVKARVTVPNPDLQLKPGMYATVELLGGQVGAYPVVPEEAILRTGDEELVLLALGGGRFRPQPVTAGVQADGKVQILEGLQGGEAVVTSAQFLIDSEARLQSALSAMVTSMDMGSEREVSMGAPGEQASESKSGATAPQVQNGVQVVEVTVGASGFEPHRIELEAGLPVRLLFTRTTDATCAKQVQAPDLGIEKTELPLHEPVTVEFTPEEDGTFTFACGMDMLKGTLVVTS